MCLAIPGKVTKLEGRQASIQYPDGQTRQAMIGLPELQTGDHVMVQMGVIVKKISQPQAAEMVKAWKTNK
jgi:hydrogenase expression/formation protein HypC